MTCIYCKEPLSRHKGTTTHCPLLAKDDGQQYGWAVTTYKTCLHHVEVALKKKKEMKCLSCGRKRKAIPGEVAP